MGHFEKIAYITPFIGEIRARPQAKRDSAKSKSEDRSKTFEVGEANNLAINLQIILEES